MRVEGQLPVNKVVTTATQICTLPSLSIVAHQSVPDPFVFSIVFQDTRPVDKAVAPFCTRHLFAPCATAIRSHLLQTMGEPQIDCSGSESDGDWAEGSSPESFTAGISHLEQGKHAPTSAGSTLAGKGPGT
jgi:hypothetical protein